MCNLTIFSRYSFAFFLLGKNLSGILTLSFLAILAFSSKLYLLCRVCVAPQSCPALCDPMTIAHKAPLSMGMDSPGKNTGVGCHALLQGIFPTQGWNPGLPHCRWIFCSLSHQGSPYTFFQSLIIFSRNVRETASSTQSQTPFKTKHLSLFRLSRQRSRIAVSYIDTFPLPAALEPFWSCLIQLFGL